MSAYIWLSFTAKCMIMDEKWVNINGCNEAYMVSNLGRVKSVDRVIHRGSNRMRLKGRILSCSKKSKYQCVSILINNKQSTKTVHSLVAKAFLKKEKQHTQVNHIDGNKHNNNVKNLEWVTCSENIIHAYKNGLNLNAKPVNQYDLNGNYIKSFDSVLEAQRATSVSDVSIGRVCRGKDRHAGGFQWRYTSSDIEVVKINKHCRARGVFIVVEGIRIVSFDSIKQAQDATGVCKESIWAVCNGKTKSAGGFQWEYINNNLKQKTS